MVTFFHLMFLPVEDEVIDAEHVECRHTGNNCHPNAPQRALLVACHQNLVLAEEACKWRNACNGKTANEECDAGDRHILVQAMHVRVLVAVNSVNNGTGAQEEQRLEHGVSEQVEH